MFPLQLEFFDSLRFLSFSDGRITDYGVGYLKDHKYFRMQIKTSMMPEDEHRSSVCHHVKKGPYDDMSIPIFIFENVSDGRLLYFVAAVDADLLHIPNQPLKHVYFFSRASGILADKVFSIQIFGEEVVEFLLQLV